MDLVNPSDHLWEIPKTDLGERYRFWRVRLIITRSSAVTPDRVFGRHKRPHYRKVLHFECDSARPGAS